MLHLLFFLLALAGYHPADTPGGITSKAQIRPACPCKYAPPAQPNDVPTLIDPDEGID